MQTWHQNNVKVLYPFGMQMKTYQADSSSYRFGFNGAEKMDLLSGEGTYDLGERYYDARIGRMFSCDPLEMRYSWQSPYAYCKNNPVWIVDILGMGDSAGIQTLNTGQKTHLTKSGDTYGSLANLYNVSIQDLRKWNGYADTKIPLGAELIVSKVQGGKKATGECENCSKQTLDKGDMVSDVQKQIYMVKLEDVSQEEFNFFKANFLVNPGKLVNNDLATYTHIDRDGDGLVSVGDHLDIRIRLAGVGDDGSVVVEQVFSTGNSFLIKVQALDGHPDAGYNYFMGNYDAQTRTFTWTTMNVTRTAVLGSALGGTLSARGLQQTQWQLVLHQVWWQMYKNSSLAGYKIQEYDWSWTTGTIGEKDGKPTVVNLTSEFQIGK